MAKLAAEIGSRPGDSPASGSAARYVLTQFTSMGYDAQFQPYGFADFRDRSAKLLLKQAQRVQIPTRTFVYSGSGFVEGTLADDGYGRSSDFAASQPTGRVVLLERGGGISFQQKVDNAVARGAVAVIVFNDRNGELRGTLARQAQVPVAGILQYDGQRLRERLKQGPVSVSLEVDASTQARRGYNVVASSPSPPNRRKVVLGAHYDSIPAGPGANDNASGVATLLELARTLQGRDYPFDLVFVSFGDEEVGLVGSKRYLEYLKPEERTRILAMINLDMVGVGDSLAFSGDQQLVNQSLQIARRAGYTASELTPRSGMTSDHASFLDAGVPAVFFHRTEDPYYHTAMDTADKVFPPNLEEAGQVALRLLEELGKRN